MKIVPILIMLMMLIPWGIASPQDISPDEIIDGNITASDPNTDQKTSNFNGSSNYTFIKDIGDAKGVEVINVHFKNAFRGADSNLATVDRIWQVSDTNSSQVIINNSRKVIITSGTPLLLEEGYELAIKSIDISGVRVTLELSKNGTVVDSRIITPPQTTDDLYTYSKNIGSAKDIEIIRVHFKNVLRGPDTNLGAIDQIWQASDTNSSQVIKNDSDGLIFTSGTPLKLEEGYELDLKSIDIDGHKANVVLSKNGTAIDEAVIIPPDTSEVELNKTLRAYEDAIKLDPVYWYNKGEGLFNSKSYNEAIEAYNKSIELDPKNDTIWLRKSIALQAMGNTREFVKTIDKAIGLNQSNGLAWLLKGSVLAMTGKYDEANKALDKAIGLNQSQELNEYALMMKVGTLWGVGKYDEANKVSDTIIGKNQSNCAAWLSKGQILGDWGMKTKTLKNINESIKAFDKVIELAPRSTYAAQAWYFKGNDMKYLGLDKEPIKCYDEAISIDPEYLPAWIEKADSYFNLGEYGGAVQAYDEIIKLNSSIEYVWRNKGIALEHLGQYNDALEAYNHAIDIDPTDARAWFGKGYSLNNQGDYEGAIKAYEKVIERDPKDAGAWNNKGNALNKLGKYDEAIDAFNKAIEIDPKDALYLRNRGNTLDLLGKYDEAINSYNKAIGIDQAYSVSMVGMGNTHRNAGEYAVAIKYYDAAIKQDPKDYNAWYNKAEVLRVLHRDSEAKAAYAKARELGYSGTMTLMEMTAN